MAFKFVLLATLVAAASAGLLPVAHHGSIATSHSTIQHHAAPAVHHVGSIHAAPAIYQHSAPTIVKTIAQPTIIKSVEHHAPANYEFSYSVHDEHTGDIKSQHETRHGDEVHGQYSLLDSDGHHRVVDYHADHHSGFNAVVRREPSAVKIAQPVHKVIAQPVHVSSYAHAPVAHATVQHHHAAPIAHYSAPIAHHAAPIAHHVAPIAHYSAPIAHHAAPIATSTSKQSSTPIMAFKFVLLATLVAAASAGLLPVAHHGSIATSHSTIQHHAAPAVHHVGSIHAAPAIYQHSAPTIVKTIAQPTIIKSVEHHAPANYEFSYSVHDEHTGDIKSQHETRHGDEVHGQYSLLDSDGHHRVVDYHADHHSGFNAVVRREPSAVKIAQPVHKVIAQPVHVSSYAHAPVAHATVQHHHAAPIAHYSAPIAHHAAPIAHHVAPIAHYSAPIAHHAAPIAHSTSSIVHGQSHLSHHHY
ncbi:histidine-rich protein PFHRP-II-like [Anopheles marshallii]|uniref:histidine-rich protein PFHRP-II-like n=1 Tax=Anopheles marshallii TaxID=1521116 RepID=UPI00237A6E71|nr:histidine-rich protein PFHRP-II-like [Anopheles marshallii]